MSLDPVAEDERVREKYAPMRPSDVAMYVTGILLLATASLFRHVDWFFFVGVVTACAAWELTKFRLRRDARRFAGSSR